MLPQIQTILYATDLEPHGPAVFRYALSLAQHYDAKIVLLHAVEPLGQTARSLVRNVLPANQIEELQKQTMERIFDEIRARITKLHEEVTASSGTQANLVSDVRVVEGFPATAVLEQADVLKADLVVMGTHGRSGMGEFVLGSVAHKVIQQSRVPVLLAPLRGLQS